MEDEKHPAKLRKHQRKTAVFARMAKLCDEMGLSSKLSVFTLVGRLTAAGYLERQDGQIAPTKKFIARPILGPVRAGLEQPVSQEKPELVTVDDYLIDEPNRTSMQRVAGRLDAGRGHRRWRPARV
jgi:repressor LexA